MPSTPLHVPVDKIERFISHHLAFRYPKLARLVPDRSRERMQLTGQQRLRALRHEVPDIGGNHGSERGEPQRALGHAAPVRLRSPRAVQHRLRHLGVELTEDWNHRCELRRRTEAGPVGVEADHALAGLLCGEGGRAGVGHVRDHVGALRDECIGRFALAPGIEPRVHLDDLDLHVRLDTPRAESEAVDDPQHGGQRERGDVADGVALGHRPGDDSREVRGLVVAKRVGPHVVASLVAVQVHELDVGEELGGFQSLIHEAEGGREDQMAAIGRELADDLERIGAVGDVLDDPGLDLVSEKRLHLLATLVVLERPAGIEDRTEVDEADAYAIECRGRHRPREHCEEDRYRCG